MERRLINIRLLFVNPFPMSAVFATYASQASRTVDIASQIVKENTTLIFTTSDRWNYSLIKGQI